MRHMGSLLQHVGSCSLTRDRTQPPALGVWHLSHWNTREVSQNIIYMHHCFEIIVVIYCISREAHI